MITVHGINKLAKDIETKERVHELSRQHTNKRVNELANMGIDRELARVMIESEIKSGIIR